MTANEKPFICVKFTRFSPQPRSKTPPIDVLQSGDDGNDKKGLGFCSARVKRIGSFVPRECGENKDVKSEASGILDIYKICLGELAYVDKFAVELLLNNGSTLVYVLNMKNPQITTTGSRQDFQGELKSPLSLDALEIVAL